MSQSNVDGFYYRNRIDLDLLLKLNPENVIITTACVGSRLNTEDGEEKFLKPIAEHFKNSLYLEVQSHNHPIQAKYNEKILFLSKKYNIPIIHANDSHYIYPDQSEDRAKLLKGKGFNYPTEEGFMLDYPDSDIILQRYKEQGVLSEEESLTALKNTLIFDQCEDLEFDKEIKMPKIYDGDSNYKLKQIIASKWHEEKKDISKEKYKEYEDAIRFEVDIVEKTNMADYFLLDNAVVERATKVYNEVLTRTGRGSCVSFYINKLLGFTEIDRVSAPVVLYPTRFMSTTRILETKSLPDIDLNWVGRDGVVQATRDILGEDHVAFMISYHPLQESNAFRNLCRAYDLEYDDYNEVAKNLDNYRKDPKWKDLIDECQKYIGVIESVSPSPCSYLLSPESISQNVGLIKIGDEMCCCIDGLTADKFKFLKNDYLLVKVWKLIANTFALANKPILSIQELEEQLDDKTWDIYKKGLTATINQCDTDNGREKVMRYAPHSIAEMSAFVASIRPSFASLVDNFLERKSYSTGVDALDTILESSFHYLMYQESIMQFLVWCGIEEDETYTIIKKISKKKFKEKELEALKEKLKIGFLKQVGNLDKFENVWQVIEDASKYAFNSSHSLSYAYDSAYGAYLKSHYPLEYFTVALNEYDGDIDETTKIISELKYFDITLNPIMFRHSKGDYFLDKETNNIYKGIGSIKYCNSIIAEELYALKDNQYANFIELLKDINEKTSVNSKQLSVLIKLNFFSEFGKSKKLLQCVEIYNMFFERKEILKSKVIELNLNEELIRKNGNETAKKFTKLNWMNIIKELYIQIPNESINLIALMKTEIENLGYTNIKLKLPDSYALVTKYDCPYTHPMITLYYVNSGVIQTIKCKNKYYNKNKFEELDMINIINIADENKWTVIGKSEDGKPQFKMLDEKEPILKQWSICKVE
jgi:DNA polymerase III alpha subunit